MSLRRTLTGIFMAAVLACTTLPAFAPSNAQAADVGFCGTLEEINQTMRTEGQRSLASGNQRILIEVKKDGSRVGVDKYVGLIFTAGAFDKETHVADVGYVLQSDKPTDQRPTKLCVADRMHHVKLYDVRKPELPQQTLLNSTPEKAAEQCDRMAAAVVISREACGFHNDGSDVIQECVEGIRISGLSPPNHGILLPVGK